MKYIVAALFLTFTIGVYSQDVSLQWAYSFGTSSNDYGRGIAVDASGNVYFLGDYQAGIDFDPGPGVHTLPAELNIAIVKFDANGNFIWVKGIGGPGIENGVCIKLDNNGNLYVTGVVSNVADIDPGPAVFTFPGTDEYSVYAFVAKLNTDGNLIWAKKFDNVDRPKVAVDAVGNVYMSGSFYGVVDFDPGPGTHILTDFSNQTFNAFTDIFLVKLDAAGNFQWVNQAGTPNNEHASDVGVDAAGNVYTCGLFYHTVDFDPGPGVYNLSSSGDVDIFITKTDPAGKLVWAKQFTGPFTEIVNNLAVSPGGDIHISGTFFGNTDFDPSTGTYYMDGGSQGDAFVAKLDKDGNFIWSSQMGGSGIDNGYGISVDPAGNVYTTGNFAGTADFDPSNSYYPLQSTDGSDIYICKLNNNGQLVWAKAMGDDRNYDYGHFIVADPSGNVYTTGFFWGTVDFDPEAGVYNLTMVDYGDAFIQKLSQCAHVTYNNITATTCNTYTLNAQVYNSPGIYTQRLTNTFGCDSIITLNLTIGGSVTNETMKACDTYTWQGNTYTSSGHYSVTYTSVSGCDSIFNLDLTIGTSKVTSVTQSICEGQQYEGYNSSGTYVDVFTTATGCDSTRTLLLTVNPVKRTTVEVDLCEGGSYFAAGANQTNSGTYTDTYQSFTGCDSIVSTVLRLHALPRPSLGVDFHLCSGANFTLHPGTFTQYQWQDNSTAASYPVQNTGKYWVKVTDNNNCSSSDTVQVLSILPTPSQFLLSIDSICQFARLNIIPAGIFKSYSWSTGSYASTITVEEPGRYILSVESMEGCTGMDTIMVYPKKCTAGVFVPSAFTPGTTTRRNDDFKALVFGEVISFSLQVYNRWGELVFSTNDPYKGWDGKVKGKEPSSETFIWQCAYHLKGSRPVVEKGTVALIR